MGESVIDPRAVATRLRERGLHDSLVSQSLAVLPRKAIGILLYGSQARGDASPESDVDILVLANGPAASRTGGWTNVTTYGEPQLAGSNGTLFGMHLARDGVILHDTEDSLLNLLRSFGPADQERIFERVKRLAVALKSTSADRVKYLDGLVRLARYLLRTATYAAALNPGPPCFSLSELAERFGIPELPVILSSHLVVHGESTLSVLEDLEYRIAQIVGPIAVNPYGSIQALIVAEWEGDRDLANSTLLVLGSPDDALPYAEIPRVIL
jgi:hypothetical protein